MASDHLYSWDYLQNSIFPSNILPKTNNTQDLGASNNKWAYIYATNFVGNLTGNADTATTATNLASAPSLAASGTTQIKVTAGGQTSSAFTVPYSTVANYLNGIGRLSASADAIAFNTSITVGNRLSWCIYDGSSRGKDATNTPSFDASVLNIPWDWGAYMTQLAMSITTTPRMQIRGASCTDNGEGTNPRYTPIYGAWREVVTATKATQMGSASKPIYINNTGQVVEGNQLGSMATETATNYVKIDGSNNMTGDLSIIAGDSDKFINFWYNTTKKAGASWRIGYKRSGSGDNNDFIIQSGGSSDVSTDSWKQHVQIKMETGIVKIHRGLEILGHIAGDGDGATGHGASGGGGYHNAYNNLILHGDSSTGTSGILFMSDKVNEDTAVVTNINATTDRAFIQYHANGITTAAAEGSNPTLATSGEVGRLIVGIGNDSNDQVWLQTPSHTGLIHQIGNASYVIPDTNNATGSVGNSILPVYVDSGIIKACFEPLIRYGTSSEAAATAAKTASITNFTLTSGVTIYVKFTNANSAATPTLNISSTGAKSITLPNGNKTPWDAGEVVSLTYDGTSWNINNYSKIEVIRL